MSRLRSRLGKALGRTDDASGAPPLDELVRPVAELVQTGDGSDPDRSTAVERIYRRSLGMAGGAPTGPPELRAAAVLTGLGDREDARALRDFAVTDLLAEGGAESAALPAWSEVRIDRGVNRRLRGSATEFEPLDLGGLRESVRNRTVAIVADHTELAGAGLGPRIDGCDLVVRFNGYTLDEADSGTRTDVHVTANSNAERWGEPVEVRIVMAGSVRTWRSGILTHLVPTAQRFVGTEALRWPLYSPSVVGAERTPHESTLPFQMVRLLDFLDVAAAVQLFGWPPAERGDTAAAELAWLDARAPELQAGLRALGPGSLARAAT